MIKAVIFDLDGVISDTQKIHANVEIDIFKNYGVNLNLNNYIFKYSGIPERVVFAEIINTHKLAQTVDQLLNEKWKRMWEKLKVNVPEIPGAKELIKLLSVHGFKLGVASSSPLKYVKYVIKTLGLTQYFNAITSGEEVTKGKPNPDIFLLAAKRLQSKSEECLVIEDGLSGMQAAQNARMKCIGYVKAKKDINYPADTIVSSLADISYSLIEKLVL